jgi:hypothetical protein
LSLKNTPLNLVPISCQISTHSAALRVDSAANTCQNKTSNITPQRSMAQLLHTLKTVAAPHTSAHQKHTPPTVVTAAGKVSVAVSRPQLS